MGTIVVFKQELGIYPWTIHILNSSLRKNAEIHLHTASALQKYNQALELCSWEAFEEVMSRRQKNTWSFQDPDSSPCSLCCVPQTQQTHWQSYQSLIFPWNRLVELVKWQGWYTWISAWSLSHDLILINQRWALDWTWIGLDPDYDKYCWFWIGPDCNLKMLYKFRIRTRFILS